jgi:hypothetical protein
MAVVCSKTTPQRRAGRHSSDDIYRALFPKGAPKRRTIDEMKEGIRRVVRERYARD